MDYQELYAKLLEAIGISKAEILRKIEELKAQYPDGAVPLDAIANLIDEHFTAEAYTKMIDEIAAAMWNLVQTGKSAVTRDPSALA